MSRRAIVAATAVFLAALAGVGAERPAAGASQVPARAAAAEPQALVNRYCLTCHSDRTKAGGLSLAALDVSQAGAQAATWEKAVRKIRTGMMPPSGAPRPDRATLDRLAAHIEGVVDGAASRTPNPGTRVLHRLNRAEYANAVRDLLDLPIDASRLLPGDDSSESVVGILLQCRCRSPSGRWDAASGDLCPGNGHERSFGGRQCVAIEALARAR